MVVREAVAEYGARTGRLTEAERRRLLGVIDEIASRPPTRPQAQVAREIRAGASNPAPGRPRHPPE